MFEALLGVLGRNISVSLPLWMTSDLQSSLKLSSHHLLMKSETKITLTAALHIHTGSAAERKGSGMIVIFSDLSKLRNGSCDRFVPRRCEPIVVCTVVTDAISDPSTLSMMSDIWAWFA